MRKSLFRQFPKNILADDLYSSVSIIGQGKRLVQSDRVLIFDIQFETYYSAIRLKRLVRGLLIYLFNHWSEIRKMPIRYQLRFLTYKYLKLVLPIIAGLLLIAFSWFTAENGLLFDGWILFGLLGLTLLAKKTRHAILFLLLLNWNFFKATVGYFFFNQRDTNWVKL